MQVKTRTLTLQLLMAQALLVFLPSACLESDCLTPHFDLLWTGAFFFNPPPTIGSCKQERFAAVSLHRSDPTATCRHLPQGSGVFVLPERKVSFQRSQPSSGGSAHTVNTTADQTCSNFCIFPTQTIAIKQSRQQTQGVIRSIAHAPFGSGAPTAKHYPTERCLEIQNPRTSEAAWKCTFWIPQFTPYKYYEYFQSKLQTCFQSSSELNTNLKPK